MRLNGNHLSKTGRPVRIVPLSKPLIVIGLAGWAVLASSAPLAAQVTTPPPPPAPADSTGTAPNGNSPDPNSLDQSAQNPNSADQSRAQVPSLSQNPNNPANTTIPQFPMQPGNPISPFTSSSSSPQSPQLTAPSLYVTGGNDLSQIGISNAISAAFGEAGTGGFLSEPLLEYDAPPVSRIRLGPFDLKAAVVSSVVADDNLRTGDTTNGGSGGGSKGDINFVLAPALLLQYGDHEGQKGYASLVYTPTFSRFVHHSDQNTDDYQNVALNAVYPFQRLTLNLSQTLAETTGVNGDSNVRTTQTSSASMIGAAYEVDEKISLATQLQEVINKVSSPSGQTTAGEGENITSLNNTATYRLSEKLSVGPSLNVGIDKPDQEAQQTFEQGLLGLNYAPTEKIGLYLQGGVEIRQYEHNGAKSNPIFSTGIAYAPFDSTSINLNASQSVHTDINATTTSSAAVMNQTVVATGVGVSVSQRIAQRFFLGFDFEYSHNENQGGTGGTGTQGTTQDTMIYRPTLQFNPTGWTSVGLYYQYEDNQSDAVGATYHDNQVGLSLSAQF